jgi:Macrocin-O-methyltransferase (TylF)
MPRGSCGTNKKDGFSYPTAAPSSRKRRPVQSSVLETASDESEAMSLSLVGEGVINGMLEVLDTVGDGCIVEVGCYKGGTAYFLDRWARSHDRAVFLYDTFTGIPYAGSDDSHRVGDFSDTSAESVRVLIPHATVVEGVFPASAVPMPPVAFVHIDVDQYQSYIDTCTYLGPHMAPGGVMWFDDANCLPSAGRAVHELYGDRIERNKLSGQDKWYVRFP